jgi:hypothetical protein
MAIRVRVSEFKGVVFDNTEGDKEYKLYEWELDDGTFEYELDCPLHSPRLHSTLQKIYSESQNEVICPSPTCKHKYFISESTAVFMG